MTKPDPKALYIAVMSFTHDPYTIKEGDRVLGSHPEVIRLPHMFVPDGSSTEDQRKARQAIESSRF